MLLVLENEEQQSLSSSASFLHPYCSIEPLRTEIRLEERQRDSQLDAPDLGEVEREQKETEVC
jgi:hypothetical protein